MPPLQRRRGPGSGSNANHEIPINELAGSQQESRREIRRRPVPSYYSIPDLEQQGHPGSASEQNSTCHQTYHQLYLLVCQIQLIDWPSNVDTSTFEVHELPAASSKQNDAFEYASSPSRAARQTQTVDPISDDDLSTLDSSSEPPPAYEDSPQTVDINQEGLHAHAAAASELKNLESSKLDSKKHAHVLNRRWTHRHKN